jgi:hypothetical protein
MCGGGAAGLLIDWLTIQLVTPQLGSSARGGGVGGLGLYISGPGSHLASSPK